VTPDDLPAKILDQVGDISLLPEIEEAGQSETAVAQSVEIVQTPVAGTAADPGSFVWPDLAVMEAHGLNLKDFLDVMENRLIDEALGKAEGVKNQAAELLGIKRTTLIEKLKKRGQ